MSADRARDEAVDPSTSSERVELASLTAPALGALLSAASVGFAVLDTDLRYIACNEQLARINGLEVAEHLGRRVRDVVPDIAEGAEKMFRQVLETGDPIREFEVSGRVPGSGDLMRHWLESVYPVPGLDGRVAAVAVVVWEVTARVEAERSRAQMLALLDLLVLRAPIGIAFLDRDLRYLRINQNLADANGLPVAAHLGRPVSQVLPHVAPDVEPLLRQVLSTGEPILDLEVETGETPAQRGRRRHWRISFYPITGVDGAPPDGVGLIVVDETDRHEAQRERQRLQIAEREALRRAEQAAARQALLQRLTAALASSVTAAEVAETTVSTIGAALSADAVTLTGYDAESDRLSVLAQRGLLDEVASGWEAFRPEDVPVAGQVVRRREPIIVTSFADRDRRFPVMAGLPVAQQAWVNLPLIAKGAVVGVVAFGWNEPRRFSDVELDLLRALAGQCAVALDRARLYAEQRRVAHRLQANLLPDALPVIAGLDLAARYVAAETAVEVGGDFYDVFAVEDGCWAAVIGDVTGRGIDAAGTTAVARHTLRALGSSHPPAAALHRLNTMLFRPASARHFLTAAYVHLAPNGDGAWTLTVARAGHPAPLVVHPTGSYTFLEPAGRILGAYPSVPLAEATYVLHLGDTLILYTDGITETHGRDGLFDYDGLASTAAATAGQPAETTARAIETALDAYNTRDINDDRALLIIRVHGG